MNDQFAELFSKRIVEVRGTLTESLAEAVTAQLLYLDLNAPGEPIYLWITDSVSGSFVAALTVLDLLRQLGSPVVTVGIGRLGGLATMLLAAGKSAQRTVLRETQVSVALGLKPVLSHVPFEGDLAGETRLGEALQLRRQVIGALVELTGHSAEQLEQLGVTEDEETAWLTAAEAVAHGLADIVADRPPP